METPQKQTVDTTLKSWDEIKAAGESPYDYVGNGLDETTVPEDKRELYDTVLAAEQGAIEAEVAEAQAIETQAMQNDREKFLAEREKARRDISGIATRGALAAAINEQQSRPKVDIATVGTYQTGYMTTQEREDFLDSRRNGTPQ